MSNLGDNIRRIAQTDELKKLIEQLLDDQGLNKKKSIKGGRSIAYQDSNGGVSSQKGAKGETVGTAVGTKKPTPNNSDGSGSETGTGDLGDPLLGNKNQYDLQDILDDGLEIGDIVNSLAGLTNCGGGKEATIYLDDAYRPYIFDGLDAYGADEDPRESQFLAGTYYIFNVLTTHNSTSAWGAVNAGLTEYDSNDPGNAPHSIVSIETYDETTISDGATLEVILNRASGQFTANITVNKGNCSVGVDVYCPSSAPSNQWPSDSVHQLKFDGGQFQTSEFENDSDINGAWGQNNGAEGPSKISGCTSGGQTVDIEAIGNGNSQITFGDGTTYKIDKNGEVFGTI